MKLSSCLIAPFLAGSLLGVRRQASKIDQRFPSSLELILAVLSHDISSPRYLGRIARLTDRIREINEVHNGQESD